MIFPQICIRLTLNECRIEDIRGGIDEEEGFGGCDVLDSGVIHVTDTAFFKAKHLFFSDKAKGIFNQCLFQVRHGLQSIFEGCFGGTFSLYMRPRTPMRGHVRRSVGRSLGCSVCQYFGNHANG